MQRVARLASLALGLSVVLAACGGASQSPAASAGPTPLSMSEDVLSSASNDGLGWYDLGSFGDGGSEGAWAGMTVSTNWITESGTIYLGPDEVFEPLLSLTMQVRPMTNADGGEVAPDELPAVRLIVTHAVMTTSDVKVGTGQEIDGRSYEGTGIITDLTIGRNYITGWLALWMDRVLFWPEDEPQSIIVVGEFLAVRK